MCHWAIHKIIPIRDSGRPYRSYDLESSNAYDTYLNKIFTKKLFLRCFASSKHDFQLRTVLLLLSQKIFNLCSSNAVVWSRKACGSLTALLQFVTSGPETNRANASCSSSSFVERTVCRPYTIAPSRPLH